MKKGHKYIIGIVLAITMLSCQKNPEKMLMHLSGYWEIEKVIFADGQEKSFTISTWVDYIEVDSTKGIRKKVSPTLEGKFRATETEEIIEIKIENDSLNLYYTTPFDSWKETVLAVDDEKLIVINAEKTRYQYKKFQPLEFN